jgi:hypothetical protein
MTEINNLRKSLEEDQKALSPIYVFNYSLEVPCQHVQFCQEWHGGQGSAFYSVGSTGVIYNEEYLNAVDCELAQVERVTELEEDTVVEREEFRKWLNKYLDNDQT